MEPVGRATIGIALGVAFFVTASGAALCHLMASNSPRSEVRRRQMTHERENLSGNEALYEPSDDMLSERGLSLRSRGRMFGRLAIGLAVLIFAWAAWAN